MKIAGYQKCSFIDYKHYHSAVIFTSGCNMNCKYCHNKDLLNLFYDQNIIYDHLRKRINQLDAVVISGGEPCLHESLVEFIKPIKEMGYKVKLDTNGSKPEVVRNLLEEKLIDYIAMDIKTVPHKYESICGIKWEQVKESVDLILANNAYEFRTTLYPEISLSELDQLASSMADKNYFIQQYRPTEYSHLEPYSFEMVHNIVSKYNVRLRGF